MDPRTKTVSILVHEGSAKLAMCNAASLSWLPLLLQMSSLTISFGLIETMVFSFKSAFQACSTQWCKALSNRSILRPFQTHERANTQKTLNGRKTNERILAFSRFQGWAITLKLSKRSCKGQRKVNSFLAGASLMAQELANTNVLWLLYLTSGSVDVIIGSMEQERGL